MEEKKLTTHAESSPDSIRRRHFRPPAPPCRVNHATRRPRSKKNIKKNGQIEIERKENFASPYRVAHHHRSHHGSPSINQHNPSSFIFTPAINNKSTIPNQIDQSQSPIPSLPASSWLPHAPVTVDVIDLKRPAFLLWSSWNSEPKESKPISASPTPTSPVLARAFF
ncbi:hypothetical protein M0R45_006198 [Rubus argutus]|uniref:Uncharacterized protein n=1 Tax=Rubus argutus TaxID=59490 RepID=A0AAW1YQG4_RUBAR